MAGRIGVRRDRVEDLAVRLVLALAFFVEYHAALFFEQVLVDSNGQKLLFTIGKHGILWKLDRETGQYLDHKETVYQNIFTKIDSKTGAVTYRQDIVDAKVGEWLAVCPSTAGGHN